MTSSSSQIGCLPTASNGIRRRESRINYFVYYNDLGTRLQGDTMMTTGSYDPRSQPYISGFLGDYQDANNWTFSNGNRWNSVWIRTAPSDVQVTDVQ